jgi:hypothetical protein
MMTQPPESPPWLIIGLYVVTLVAGITFGFVVACT